MLSQQLSATLNAAPAEPVIHSPYFSRCFLFSSQPISNLNKVSVLDFSPAVRDFLWLGDTDVTDWRFVDFEEIPHGPWAQFGDNNTFVINQRGNQKARVDKAGATALMQ